MPRVTWLNISDAANRDIQSRIDSVSRAASWSNIPTWDTLNNSVEMELMRRKSQWNNLGMTDEELLKEMIEEVKAAQKR